MSTRICPVCGTDYLDWAERCTMCGVPLVPLSASPDPLRLPEDQQVVYELGVWPLGMQASAAQRLAESGIPHAWDRTDLVIHLDHEAAVDELLEEVEREQPGVLGADWLEQEETRGASEGSQALEDEDEDSVGDLDGGDLEAAEGPTANGDAGGVGDELEYELDEWSTTDRAELGRRLQVGGIPFRWEGDDVLVVAARDEALVEGFLDEIEYPDALPSEDEDAEDEASFELMSGLFVAADRLKSNPRDPDGIEGLSSFVTEADGDRPPFGVEPAVWRSAVDQANDLADRLAGVGDEDEDGFLDDEVDDDGEPLATADDVSARASVLRDVLRPFV